MNTNVTIFVYFIVQIMMIFSNIMYVKQIHICESINKNRIKSKSKQK